jgi:hypothetical protein
MGEGDGGEIDADEADPGASSDFDAAATAPTPEIDEDRSTPGCTA